MASSQTAAKRKNASSDDGDDQPPSKKNMLEPPVNERKIPATADEEDIKSDSEVSNDTAGSDDEDVKALAAMINDELDGEESEAEVEWRVFENIFICVSCTAYDMRKYCVKS
jgi:hypothetical protein